MPSRLSVLWSAAEPHPTLRSNLHCRRCNPRREGLKLGHAGCVRNSKGGAVASGKNFRGVSARELSPRSVLEIFRDGFLSPCFKPESFHSFAATCSNQLVAGLAEPWEIFPPFGRNLNVACISMELLAWVRRRTIRPSFKSRDLFKIASRFAI